MAERGGGGEMVEGRLQEDGAWSIKLIVVAWPMQQLWVFLFSYLLAPLGLVGRSGTFPDSLLPSRTPLPPGESCWLL